MRGQGVLEWEGNVSKCVLFSCERSINNWKKSKSPAFLLSMVSYQSSNRGFLPPHGHQELNHVLMGTENSLPKKWKAIFVYRVSEVHHIIRWCVGQCDCSCWVTLSHGSPGNFAPGVWNLLVLTVTPPTCWLEPSWCKNLQTCSTVSGWKKTSESHSLQRSCSPSAWSHCNEA